ncbi:hypothetical protein CYY_003330 [Polysphondylium violaceum]|uniref:Uncharacterized protein n=1 Tax=Polysphondylium violaceum TaxID=133409 RepID=A0A8J4PZV2_9MYCE|nr:hypothetical protein CYY_003330 [Polysphondylium violaceum]
MMKDKGIENKKIVSTLLSENDPIKHLDSILNLSTPIISPTKQRRTLNLQKKKKRDNSNNATTTSGNNIDDDDDDLFHQTDKLESGVSSIISVLIDLKKSLFNTINTELEKSNTKKATIIHLQEEITTLETKKQELIHNIQDKNNGILSNIQESVNYDQELRERLSSIESILHILDYLGQYKNEITGFDDCVAKNDYIFANHHFQNMTNLMNHIPSQITSTHPHPRILPSLKDNLKKRKNLLKTTILELFTNAIVISPNEIQLSLGPIDQHVIHESSSPPSHHTFSSFVPKLVDSLNSLGLINFIISSISVNIFQTILQPLYFNSPPLSSSSATSPNDQPFYSITPKWTNQEEGDPFPKVYFEFNQDFKYISTEELYLVITNLINFICNNIFGSNKEYIKKFGDEFWNNISSSILEYSLKYRIPDDIKGLEWFSSLRDITIQFENHLSSIGLIKDQDKKLTSFVENIELHYSEKKRNILLFKAREIILNDRYKSIYSDESIFGEFQPNDGNISGYYFNNRIIFQSCHQILDLCKSAFKESFLSHSICQKSLYHGSRDILDIFYCIYLKHHKDKLETVPSLACLFYNSCMFLSHSCMFLALEFSSNQLVKKETFLDFSPRFKQLGNQFFSKYIKNQLESILSFIVEHCNQLDGTKDLLIFNKIESNFKRMILELSKLSETWKESFPREDYLELITKFVESIISIVIKMILNLQNIEVIETTRLVQLISIFSEFEKFFEFPGEGDVGKSRMKLVKNWKKLYQISTVLELSLSEIVNHYKQGLLKKILNHELRLLILSIFDDFELKTNFLAQLNKSSE